MYLHNKYILLIKHICGRFQLAHDTSGELSNILSLKNIFCRNTSVLVYSGTLVPFNLLMFSYENTSLLAWKFIRRIYPHLILLPINGGSSCSSKSFVFIRINIIHQEKSFMDTLVIRHYICALVVIIITMLSSWLSISVGEFQLACDTLAKLSHIFLLKNVFKRKPV